MDGQVLFQRKEITAKGGPLYRWEMRHTLVCWGCEYQFGTCFADVLFAFDDSPILDYGSVVLRHGFRKNAAGTFVRNRPPRRLPGTVIHDEASVYPTVLPPQPEIGPTGYALDVSWLPIFVQCPRCSRRNIVPRFNVWRNPRTGEVGL